MAKIDGIGFALAAAEQTGALNGTHTGVERLAGTKEEI
jgi:hypothetical protein